MELKRQNTTTMRLWEVLLIVPYGIETAVDTLILRYLASFNRTLWN